jgi:hypothetical protein
MLHVWRLYKMGILDHSAQSYSRGTDHKENTVSDSSTIAWRHYRNGPQWKHPLLHRLLLPRNPPQRKRSSSIVARVTVSRQRPSFVDCWPTACTSQYLGMYTKAKGVSYLLCVLHTKWMKWTHYGEVTAVRNQWTDFDEIWCWPVLILVCFDTVPTLYEVRLMLCCVYHKKPIIQSIDA